MPFILSKHEKSGYHFANTFVFAKAIVNRILAEMLNLLEVKKIFAHEV